MSRYKSEQTEYSPLKKKSVPLRRLDTNTLTVTHFNTDTQTEESKTYSTDFSTLMIWSLKSVKLSPVRWSFGSRLTVAIRKLPSAMMPRRCSVWRTALSIWREKRCLSVWFIFDYLRLCFRVQL